LVHEDVAAVVVGVGHEVLPAGVDEAVVFPAQQDQVVDVCAAVIGGPLGPVVGLAPGGRKVAFATVSLS